MKAGHVRGDAHIGRTMVPPGARLGLGQRLGLSKPPTRRPPQRLDDLVREVGGRRLLGPRAVLLAWGFGGFLIGAIFWHFIGFWGFLNEAVLKSPEARVSVVARVVPPAKLPNCTTLALNRATGRTMSVPCPERMPLLEEAGITGRRDLAFAGVRLHGATSIPVSGAAGRGVGSARHDN